jgi:hypothetical protein
MVARGGTNIGRCLFDLQTQAVVSVADVELEHAELAWPVRVEDEVITEELDTGGTALDDVD